MGIVTTTRLISEVDLSWSVPAGSPPTAYDVSVSPAAPAGTPTQVTTTSMKVPGLTSGTTYTFKVRGVNAVGPGSWSPDATETPAAQPSAPQTVTATSTINSITLSWAAVAPPADGGSPVTGYRASCAVGSSGGSVDVAGGVTSATIPALAPGTNYSCRVRVSTQAGGRTTSTPINVPTQDVVPGTVSALGGAAGVRSVSLAWNPPAPNGGSAVQRYVVRLSACGGKQTLPTTTSVTLTGLSSRCTFTASVAARNRKGDGPAATATFTTPDAPPGAVRRLTASPGDGALTVSWSAPSTHGETHPSGYQVSIWYPGKVEYSNVVTTNRVVVKRLRPGARTKVSVTPLSPLGAGAATVVQVVPGVRLAPVGAVRQRVATGRTATIGVKIIVLQSLKPLKNDRIDVFLVGRGKPKLLGRIKTNAKGVAVFRFKVTKSAILLLRPTSKSVLGKRFTLLAA